MSYSQLVADLGNIIKKVQENERETLVYYAFTVAQKNEVIVIERLVHASPPSRFSLAINISLIFSLFVFFLIAFNFRYANQAALDKHRAAPYFQDFLKKAPTLLAKPLELKSGNHLLLDSAKIV